MKMKVFNNVNLCGNLNVIIVNFRIKLRSNSKETFKWLALLNLCYWFLTLSEKRK